MDQLLEDSTLFQAVLATIPHGCVVYSLDGPVNGLEDILLQAFVTMGAVLTPGWGQEGMEPLTFKRRQF